MKLFNKVAIIGIGLIGGSIALAIRKKGLADKIIGVSRSKKTLLLAKKIKAIDSGSLDINIAKNADFIILATPVGTILNLAPQLSKIINKNTLVTDVGSTKQEIVGKLEKIFPKYVGSHPLAGSEKRGINYSASDIFIGTLCILTPTRNTNPEALKKIRKFWLAVGARVVFLKPCLHDKVLSFVSHLPHIVAFSLISTVPQKYLRFAASGLKDTTRIASSDEELWCDIFLSNSQSLIESLNVFERYLSKIKSAIKKGDKKLLSHILNKARGKREILK